MHEVSSRPRWLPRVLVAALVVCSATARLLSARSFDAPWIAPDEMIYGLIGRSFWESGRLALLGVDAPFYGLYPVVAGLPPALFGTATGIAVLQALQALLASAAAAIVYAWARPAAGSWAFAAAILTALLPALAYSGLLMTEAVFLPAATVALWAMARALAQPRGSHQLAVLAAVLLAFAVRIQAIVLLPILVGAVGLCACFARELGVVRRFAPTLVMLGVLAFTWIGFSLLLIGHVPSPLGAYSATTSSGYDRAEAALWIFRHAGDLFLLVLGAPLVATAILACRAARGLERDPRVRALVAVALSSCICLTVQVGAFASRYVDQLAERDLIAAAPPLFACFAVWLSRGLPRPQPAASILAALIAVPALLLPVRSLANDMSVPDAFMMIPLTRVLETTSPRTAELVWIASVVTMVALALLVPRRAAVALPGILAAALAATSVLTAQKIDERTQSDRAQFFGTAARDWVNASATGPVTYLYDGNPFWNAVWQTVYWNERIRWVAKLPGPSPGAVPQTTSASPRLDGTLVDARGQPIPGAEVVASTAFTLVGTAVATIRQQEVEQAGLRLWRTAGSPRLSTWTAGLRANGDIQEPVRIFAFACGSGRLELTLLGRRGTPVEIDVDGAPRLRVTPPPGGVWRGSIPAPANAGAQSRCLYEIRSSGLVTLTRMAFVRG